MLAASTSTGFNASNFNGLNSHQPTIASPTVRSKLLVGLIDTGFKPDKATIAPTQILWGWNHYSGNGASSAQPTNHQHGSAVLNVVTASGSGCANGRDRQPLLWLGRAVGTGQWAASLVEFVTTVRALGTENAVINLSFDLVQLNPDGQLTTRFKLAPQEQAALQYAHQQGVLIVAAAGNTGGAMSALGQAARMFDNIITVGAAEQQQRAVYSSYGPGLALIAPGRVTDSTGTTRTGTSIAAAHVTQVVQQIWAANPGLSYRQVGEILKTTATRLEASVTDVGAGLLNQVEAVNRARVTQAEPHQPPQNLLPPILTLMQQSTLERPAWGIKIPNPIKVIKDVGSKAVDTAKSVGNTVVNGAQAVGSAVVDGAQTVGNTVVDGAQAVGGAVVDTVQTVGNTVVNTAQSVGNTVVDTVQATGGAVVDAAQAVGNTVVDVTQTAVNTAIDGTQTVIGAVGGDVINQAIDSVQGAVNGAVDGVQAAGNTVVDTAQQVGNTVIDTAQTVGNTAVNGVQQAGNTVVDTAQAAGNAVVDTVQAVDNTIVDAVQTAGNAAVDTAQTVGNAIDDAVGWVSDKTQDATSWTTDKLGDAVNWTTDKLGDGTDWVFDQAGNVVNWGFDKIGDGAKWVLEQVGLDAAGKFVDDAFNKAGAVGNTIFDKAGNIADAAIDEAGIISNTVIDTIGNGPDAVIAKVGDKLLGALQRGESWLTDLPDRFKRLGQDYWDMVQSIGQGRLGDAAKAWARTQLDWVEIAGIPELAETAADLLKLNTRSLTSEEKAIAKSVFGDSINLDLVRIDEQARSVHAAKEVDNGEINRPFTTFHTINTWGPIDRSTLIHELTHVWQYEQDGAIYIPQALQGQHSDTGYSYTIQALENHRAANQGLTVDFNREQQAQIIEDYYAKRESGNLQQESELASYTFFVREVSSLYQSASESRVLEAGDTHLVLLGNAAIDGIGNDRGNEITGNDASNHLAGLAGNDRLLGRAGTDELNGGEGEDRLFGGSEDDILLGGAGDDLLVGGAGNDTLTGGTGKDQFGFLTSGEGIDSIQDFSVADDVIRISPGFDSNLTPGVIAANQFQIGSTASSSDQRFIYDAGTGALFYDSDGTGSAAQVQFAQLSPGLALNHSNIVVG